MSPIDSSRLLYESIRDLDVEGERKTGKLKHAPPPKTLAVWWGML